MAPAQGWHAQIEKLSKFLFYQKKILPKYTKVNGNFGIPIYVWRLDASFTRIRILSHSVSLQRWWCFACSAVSSAAQK